MKVLIADDDPMFRLMLERQVHSWGYDVVTAKDGTEAWDILRGERAPNIALLDWQMPGEDGIGVCRRIRADAGRPFTYTIMLTSRDAKEDMVAGLEAGADDYLAKPVDPTILRSHLSAASRIVEAVPPREWSVPKVPGYDVLRLLGRGMSGAVWEAKQLSTGQSVALKIMRRDLVTQEMIGRFSREIAIAQQLDHPYIARIIESRFDEAICFYSMELVHGVDLGKYVAQQRPTTSQLLALMVKVCAGVDHAHRRGVVHRDLKPGNILVSAEGEPKVLDFGLAKFMLNAAMHDEVQTLQDTAIGTPMYMSPEQAAGRNDKVDARSDVYALATMIYMAITGHHPHKLNRGSRWEFVDSIAQGEVRPLRLFKPNVQPALEAIVLKALSKHRNDRYQSAGEFGAALGQYLRQSAQ